MKEKIKKLELLHGLLEKSENEGEKLEVVTLATPCHSNFLLQVHKTAIHIGVPFSESKTDVNKEKKASYIQKRSLCIRQIFTMS